MSSNETIKQAVIAGSRNCIHFGTYGRHRTRRAAAGDARRGWPSVIRQWFVLSRKDKDFAAAGTRHARSSSALRGAAVPAANPRQDKDHPHLGAQQTPIARYANVGGLAERQTRQPGARHSNAWSLVNADGHSSRLKATNETKSYSPFRYQTLVGEPRRPGLPGHTFPQP